MLRIKQTQVCEPWFVLTDKRGESCLLAESILILIGIPLVVTIVVILIHLDASPLPARINLALVTHPVANTRTERVERIFHLSGASVYPPE